jgi:hypothetical protein
MTTVFFNAEHVPAAARPPAVAKVVAETLELRDRFRDAQAAVARAQDALEKQEQADVEAAAKAIRSGAPAPAVSTTIKKGRDELEKEQRSANILRLASETAAMDATEVIRSTSGDWQAALETEIEQARHRAVEALDAFEAALSDARAAAAASLWITNATEDGRFDRPPRPAVLGAFAPGSRRLTANQEPIDATTLLGLALELVEGPAPVSVIVEPATAVDAT